MVYREIGNPPQHMHPRRKHFVKNNTCIHGKVLGNIIPGHNVVVIRELLL
jgi:hypothetical protein